MRYILLLLVMPMLVIAPLVAQAQWSIWEGADGQNKVICNQSGEGPCTFCDFVKVAANVVGVLRNLAFGVAVIAIIAGAILMIISAGNPGRFNTGKSFIINAIIGVVIALMAWIIIGTVLHLLTRNPNLPWNEIIC